MTKYVPLKIPVDLLRKLDIYCKIVSGKRHKVIEELLVLHLKTNAELIKKEANKLYN